MRLLLTTILCFTLAHTVPARDYNSFGNSREKGRFCFRGELGWQQSYFTALGLSYVKNDLDYPRSFAYVAYIAPVANFPSPLLSSSYSAFRYSSTFTLGCKAGFEISANYLLLGVEYKWDTDLGNNQANVATPKAGLSFNSFVNLIYGYNIILPFSDYENVGNHMISFSINI